MQIAVIGIGQAMRGDDGAGPEAVRNWNSSHSAWLNRERVRVRILEQAGPELLDALQGMDAAVLVDAVQSGKSPGTIQAIAVEDLSAAENRRNGTHGLGVAETLALGRALGQLPASLVICILGIEAQQTALGAPLSETVRRSLAATSAAIEARVQALLSA